MTPSSQELESPGIPGRFIVICAGKGGTGQAGEKGRDGVSFSSSVRGGAGGDRNRKPLFPGAAVEVGNDGDWVNFNGVRVAAGGPGGHAGVDRTDEVLDANIYEDCQDGYPGWNGMGGVQGAPGAAAKLDYGFFTKLNGNLHWMGGVSGQGAAGSPGAGGGGGGAGGCGRYTYSPNLNDHFRQSSSGIVVYGGKGSDGGNGGDPGGGGYGGYSGGGAFGLVINNSTVTSAGLVLIGGKGGRGGAGGPGERLSRTARLRLARARHIHWATARALWWLRRQRRRRWKGRRWRRGGWWQWRAGHPRRPISGRQTEM
jgi:hypothetical protein